MKKIINLIVISIFLFIVSPFIVNAQISVTGSTSLTVGETGTIIISTSANEAGYVAISSSNTSVLTTSSTGDWLEGSLSFTVTAKAAGTANIIVTLTDVAASDGSPITGTRTLSVTVKAKENPTPTPTPTPSPSPSPSKSTVNTLKSLTVSGCIISFNANTTSYKCSETTSESVTISATPTDSKAKVTGIGKKNLNYGSNTFSIVVTSESGSKKTYTVIIPRKDDGNGDRNLKSLKVNGNDVSLDPSKTDYNMTVEKDVTSVKIEAEASDSSASISGTGTYDLVDGENVFLIQVTTSNGGSKIYTLIITREGNKDGNHSTKLTKLVVNDKIIEIKGTTYLIGVANNISKLSLVYETSSKTSTYEVSGNDNLVDGVNIVTITVKDEGETDTVYTLIVYKDEANKIVINDINNINNLDDDTIFKISSSKEHILTEDIVDIINNSKKNLYYNVTNNYDGLLYSLQLNADIGLKGLIELNLFKITGNPLAFGSSIPSGVRIKLFLDDIDVKYLYSYDIESNTYKLISDDLEIVNNYIEFTSDGSNMYVFSKDVIKNKESSDKKTGIKEWFTRLQYLLGGLLIGGVIAYIFKDKIFKIIRPENN